MSPDTAEMYYFYNFTMEYEAPCEFFEQGPSYSLIPVLCAIIFILGFSGNVMVIVSVLKSGYEWRAADVYMAHLALADLMFTVTLPLWAAYLALSYRWPFGGMLFKISSYVELVNMFASVFCLTCMSFDCYLAIARSRDTIVALLPTVWLASLTLAVPPLLFCPPVTDLSGQRICEWNFSTMTSDQEKEMVWMVGLTLSYTVFGFALPFLAITVCYCFIGHDLKGVRMQNQRRRLLKLIATLVVAYALCWMPNHVFSSVSVLSYLDLVPTTCSLLNALWLGYPYTTCLSYMKSCLMPFLYAFFDQRFRAQCLQLLRLGGKEDPESSTSSQVQKPGAHTTAVRVEDV